MHPLIAQQFAAERIDRLTHEAEARRLTTVTSTKDTRPSAWRERIILAVGRVHLVHRGSAA